MQSKFNFTEEKEHILTSDFIIKKIHNINSPKKKESFEKDKLVREIWQTLSELESARDCFNLIEDEDLIDYAIHRENAALTKLSFLFRKAKLNKDIFAKES